MLHKDAAIVAEANHEWTSFTVANSSDAMTASKSSANSAAHSSDGNPRKRYTSRSCYLAYTLTALVFTSAPVCTQALFTLQPPKPVQNFFVNETFASARCVKKYLCGTDSQDVIECSCHRYCSVFNDCCQNWIPPGPSPPALERRSYQCVPSTYLTFQSFSTITDKSLQAIYVVNKCPSYFASQAISSWCEHPLSQTANGTLSTLVTDPATGVTYRNTFCAFCHSANVTQLLKWKAFNVCYDAAGVGYDVRGVGYLPPGNLPHQLHSCIEGLVDTCPECSTEMEKRDCSNGQMRPIYDSRNQTIFRNWNCSNCNNHAQGNWECSKSWNIQFSTFPFRPSPNPNCSTPVGNDYRCPRNGFSSPTTPEEIAFWNTLCPPLLRHTGPISTTGPDRLTSNDQNNRCSEFVTPSQLMTLFNESSSQIFDIASDHVWLRYNSSYAFCAKCLVLQYTLPPTFSNGSAKVVLGARLYTQPFFKTLTNRQGVLACSTETLTFERLSSSSPYLFADCVLLLFLYCLSKLGF